MVADTVKVLEHHNHEKEGWVNKLFWGDNTEVMKHLTETHAGTVDLIYIDPPFGSDANYNNKIKLRGDILAEDSLLFEEKQYTDYFTKEQYKDFIFEKLTLCRQLLADTGSIYVHCDWHKSHHIRVLLDEVFGEKNFVNEIIWSYVSGGVSKKCFARKHDTIFLYSRQKNKHTFNLQQEKAYTPDLKPRQSLFEGVKQYQDDRGWYTWRYVRDVWDIPIIGRSANERENYPTQKPETLLERIIGVSTNPGDLVLDVFMGSGTTPVVTAKMGRRFIGADCNETAVNTTIKRLTKMETNVPFQVLETQKHTPTEASLEVDLADCELVIKHFCPKTLVNKIEQAGKNFSDWRQLVDTVMIDWNYDGEVFKPGTVDIATKKNVVKGAYHVPHEYKNIAIKIVDITGSTIFYQQ